MLPKVVIVGRPNVGKSSLFNMLAGRRVSIVDPTSGTTRDRVSAVIAITPNTHSPGPVPRFIELIDTGGHGIEDVQNLTAEVERQIVLALSEASIIMFVVDAQCGLTLLDEQVAELLRTTANQREAKHIVLTANKVDGAEHEPGALEATRFGFGAPIMVSATSGYRKRDLMGVLYERITQLEGERGDLGTVAQPPDEGVLIAIVGKRNSGKSTLVNTLAGETRVIVSEVEGTTRDAIDVRFEIDGRRFTAIDTAGIRRRKSLGDDIGYYSYHRSLRSIRRGDVVLCLIDATVPVSQVDRQIGNELLLHYKPTVIVVNKWDLAEERHTQDEYVAYLDNALKGISFAPIAFISARQGQGVRDVVAMAMNLYQQAGHRVPTAKLNQVMKQILSQKTPSSKSGHHPKIYYVSQLDNHPPTIGLWVNHPDMFDNTYRRFLLNRLRDHMPWSEVPIKLLIRGKNRLPEEATA